MAADRGRVSGGRAHVGGGGAPDGGGRGPTAAHGPRHRHLVAPLNNNTVIGSVNIKKMETIVWSDKVGKARATTTVCLGLNSQMAPFAN